MRFAHRSERADRLPTLRTARRYFAAVVVVLLVLVPPLLLLLLDPLLSPPPLDPLLDDVVLVLVELVELVELLLLPLLLVELLFEPPEYRSEYQPPPFRMKFPEVICRFAAAL